MTGHPILACLAASPKWHSILEIAAVTELLPIQVQNCLDALTVARMVEWRAIPLRSRAGGLLFHEGRICGISARYQLGSIWIPRLD